MSGSLRRVLNPVEEIDNVVMTFSPGAMTGVYPPPPHQQEAWPQYYDHSVGQPQQNQYHEPSYIYPESDVPVMEPGDSLPELFNGILLDPSNSDQMPLLDPGTNYNLADALAEWGGNVASPNSSRLTPIPAWENSQSPALEPESTQSNPESTDTSHDEETICYGMLHNIDVKLIGDGQTVEDRLRRGDAGYERFTLKEHQDHILLCFHADGKDFGYLRLHDGKVLTPLLTEPHVKLEPIVSASSLKQAIERAKKPTEAMVKVDINIYGWRQEAAKVGDVLSKGKLWLQKSDHATDGVDYENPHFLAIKINGVQVQSVQPVNQVVNEGVKRKKHRVEQLQKMVEEVYRSVDNTRDLQLVDGGSRVAQRLLKHQQEALGFMLERESGNINDKYRLWQMKVLDDGREEYRHKITKAKRLSKPDEKGGGILADEMGMGKSLSILALITKTLDDGQDWAHDENQSAEGKKAPKYSRSTLVVVSSELLINNWMKEIAKHLKGDLKVIKYHGTGRPKDLATLQDSDIVVTTYNTLTTEFQKKSEVSLLHQVGWYRVVLDEAHIIRRSATTFYHACYDLHARSRWCLTGTPIQNKLTDIGTLFAFIRAEPFTVPRVFRKWIEVPFDQSVIDPSLVDPTVVRDRLVVLLEALCLRRTKEVVKLPGPVQVMKELEFSPEEREQYENTKKILMLKIRQGVSEVEESSKFGLFQANLQMRILCNHGTYQKLFSWQRHSYQDEREAQISALGQNAEITCSSCRQVMPILGSSRLGNGFREQCTHVLCSDCLEYSSTPAAGTQLPHCPVCIRWRTRGQATNGRCAAEDMAMTDAPSRVAIEDDDDYYFNPEGHSTKMDAIIKDVRDNLWTTKSIIFSCWTRTLHLLSKHLDKAEIPHLRIDGGCPPSQRQTKLDQFATEDEWPVLIMTTGTGAFGLNLTCANRVFIVELQWNPAVENQAIARAIRLGQDSEVLVTRYMIKDTVEKEMREQQLGKKKLAAIGFEEMHEGD